MWVCVFVFLIVVKIVKKDEMKKYELVDELMGVEFGSKLFLLI